MTAIDRTVIEKYNRYMDLTRFTMTCVWIAASLPFITFEMQCYARTLAPDLAAFNSRFLWVKSLRFQINFHFYDSRTSFSDCWEMWVGIFSTPLSSCDWYRKLENVPLTMKQFFCIPTQQETWAREKYFTVRVMDKLLLSDNIFFISSHVGNRSDTSWEMLREWNQLYRAHVSINIIRWIIQVLKKINKVLSLCFEFQYFPCHGLPMPFTYRRRRESATCRSDDWDVVFPFPFVLSVCRQRQPSFRFSDFSARKNRAKVYFKAQQHFFLSWHFWSLKKL